MLRLVTEIYQSPLILCYHNWNLYELYYRYWAQFIHKYSKLHYRIPFSTNFYHLVWFTKVYHFFLYLSLYIYICIYIYYPVFLAYIDSIMDYQEDMSLVAKAYTSIPEPVAITAGYDSLRPLLLVRDCGFPKPKREKISLKAQWHWLSNSTFLWRIVADLRDRH